MYRCSGFFKLYVKGLSVFLIEVDQEYRLLPLSNLYLAVVLIVVWCTIISQWQQSLMHFDLYILIFSWGQVYPGKNDKVSGFMTNEDDYVDSYHHRELKLQVNQSRHFWCWNGKTIILRNQFPDPFELAILFTVFNNFPYSLEKMRNSWSVTAEVFLENLESFREFIQTA